jgi:ubiquinone biosynthesis protein COQ9
MMQVDDETAVVLDALLPHVAFDGWSETALRRGLRDLGRAPEDARLLFPGGAGEMIEAFFALGDARMGAAAQAMDVGSMRVPARVRAILALRFAQARAHKEAIRRALAWLSLPVNGLRGSRITAATVDAVWHAAGDRSADFSWYTKRGILAAVYGATLLYWLRDASEDDAETLLFLDRRLEGVARIGKLRKRIEARLRGLPGRG